MKTKLNNLIFKTLKRIFFLEKNNGEKVEMNAIT